jgi:peptidyl-prolyl cis-trans isomerase-like 4
MAVLLDTSAGEVVLDLFVHDAPVACRNFLSLCKLKYYNNCLIYNIQQNYILQTGDPTGTGIGGSSAYGLVKHDEGIVFDDEINKARKFDKVGLVCMAHQRPNANKSQFFITLRDEDLDHLVGQYTIFGEVSEGHETLSTLNNLYCDGDGRPYQDVRIRHTYVLDDPLDEIPGLVEPSASPVTVKPDQETVKARIPYEQNLDDVLEGRTEAEIEQSIKRKEAHSRAMVLEMVGDIPDVEAKPPVEVLFVCKLNAVTTDADLEIIFARFGNIRKCEIIRDYKTGDSLNYAFIEFDNEESCIRAYEKMNNVLIDDRRIKVDFSQSVAHLWNKYTQKPRQAHKPLTIKPSSAVATSSQKAITNGGSSEGNYQRNRKSDGDREGHESRRYDRRGGTEGSRYNDRVDRHKNGQVDKIHREDRGKQEVGRDVDRMRSRDRSRERDNYRNQPRDHNRRDRSRDRGNSDDKRGDKERSRY